MVIQYSFRECVQPSGLPLLAARVPKPFHVLARENFGKKKVN